MRASRPSELPVPVGSVPRGYAIAPSAKVKSQGGHGLSVIRDPVLRARSVGGEDFQPPPDSTRTGRHESGPESGAAPAYGPRQPLVVEERCSGQH